MRDEVANAAVQSVVKYGELYRSLARNGGD